RRPHTWHSRRGRHGTHQHLRHHTCRVGPEGAAARGVRRSVPGVPTGRLHRRSRIRRPHQRECRAAEEPRRDGYD
ncbi:hypothetical protein BN1723_020720, partial [Verticillium longisporum]